MNRFTNPILSGFHPDPSICRVGGDYDLLPLHNAKPSEGIYAATIRDRDGIFTPLLFLLLLLISTGASAVHAQTVTKTVIKVDAAAKRHPISPLIYGVCFGSKAQMAALNFTLNRQGGNNFTRYNWRTNTVNIDNDYFFESILDYRTHFLVSS